MDNATRKTAVISAGAMSLVVGQPALALPPVQYEMFTVGIVGTNNHAFGNIGLIFKEQNPDGSLGSTTFKFWDKASPVDSLSFAGPGDETLPKSFMVIGEYLDAAGSVGGVFMTMEGVLARMAIDTHIKFDGLFPDTSVALGNFTSLEVKIENALETHDTAVLDQLYKESIALNNGSALLLDTPAAVGKLVEFSTATDGGTITVNQQSVPEPATWWTVLVGSLGLFGLRWARPNRPGDVD